MADGYDNYGIPARRKALLGEVSSSGEMIDCEQITEFIFHSNTTFQYCGTSDGIAYYLSTEEIKRLDEEAAHRAGEHEQEEGLD